MEVKNVASNCEIDVGKGATKDGIIADRLIRNVGGQVKLIFTSKIWAAVKITWLVPYAIVAS